MLMAWRFSSPFLRGVKEREDNLVRPALPPPEILIECNFAKEPGTKQALVMLVGVGRCGMRKVVW